MSDIFEKLAKEWPVISGAPWSFAAAVIVLTGALATGIWLLMEIKYGGTLTAKDATIEILKTQIATLPKSAPPVIPARDPDGIYQLGQQVGLVQLPQVDETRGIVLFGAITKAMKLNTDKDFEYRSFILHIKGSPGTVTTTKMAGEINRSFQQVACEIVGRTPP
jgi:hypothetical protein